MSILPKRRGPIEHIILETRPPRWVVLSMGACGIFARALVSRQAARYRESESIALTFASAILQKVGCALSHDKLSIPQILTDTADAVIDDPEHVNLLCTTWRYLPEQVEICSVGSNSVLAFEKDTIREVVVPHTVNELLRRQGQLPDPRHRMYITHALGSKRNKGSCRIDDVRVVCIPLLPTTTIAIIEERLLADAVLEHHVLRDQLFAFIEGWHPQRRKTSILISG